MALMLDPSRNPPTPNTQADADFSMQSAVLYGLSQSLENTIQQLPYNCPSGNCTWPAYESLSVCSRCNDLASSVEQLSDMGAQYVTLMTDNNAVSISNGTAFRLPNGLFIDNQDGWQWGASSNGAMMMTTYGTGNASKTVSMQDLDTLIWSLGILKASPNPTNDTAEWPYLPISATECALYYCINRYDTTVRNGTLHETATPVAGAKRAADSWQPVDFPESWRPLNDTMLASIEFDEYFSCIERSDLALEAPDGERFNVSQNAVDSISAYFKSTFETSLRSYNETNHTVEGQINGWYMNSTTIQYKPSAIQPFYKSDDLNATFKTLATSMTNALRSDADSDGVGSNSPQQAGETGRVVTYYRIRWPWIALHCAVVVGAAVFLGLTIWESGGPGGAVPVWKSSSLAAMSRGGHVAELLDGAESVEEMEERARKGQVVLFGKDGEIMRGGGGTTAYERSG
ncbi:hypothetical protein BKCO1_1130001 [Neofusicoccum parvum]|uniref:Uncharacterized protein n=1 Tax=Neofusicoccum parvum TaxID=310453 RepID=A0ACB5SMI6_9PEZI|nr:hypothetical protein BKCO1_1130001 [Neofusicoccum parvum]